MDRPSHYVGVNVFVIRNGELLLGKRKNAAGDGEWGLPGGHLEHCETFEECAVRELLEETGLRADGVSFIGVTHQAKISGEKHYVNFGFLAHNSQGDVVCNEPEHCYEWKWFSLHMLPEPLFFGHKDLIINHFSSVHFSEWKS